jgi:hypothetical protein
MISSLRGARPGAPRPKAPQRRSGDDAIPLAQGGDRERPALWAAYQQPGAPVGPQQEPLA